MKRDILPLAETLLVHRPFPPRRNLGARRIDILHAFHVRGPGIWAYRPVLEAWVDIGELEDFPSNTLPGLYERLSTWLPTLIEHHCTIGERGGFLRRLREGTWSAHILEHVMIELQNLAGVPSGFGQARETSERGLYKVVVATPDAGFGRAALFAARDLLMAAIDDQAFDVQGAIAALREQADALRLSPDAACIAAAASQRRIPCLRLNDGNLLQLGYGARARRVWLGEAGQSGAIAQGIAEEAELSRSLLQSCGLPVLDTEAEQEGEAGANNACRLSYRLLIVGGRLAAATQLQEGAVRDVLPCVNPEFAAAAALAARVIHLEVADVHIAADDIAQPMHGQQVAILRVDAQPALQLHSDANTEARQRIGQIMVDHLMAGKDGGRIPVVGITGSHGKTTVARLVARLLGAQGARVGLASSDGLYLGQRRLDADDAANWESAQRLLRNPLVEAAVVENSYRAMVTEGLAYDRCQVGIVLNLDADDTLPDYDLADAEKMEKVIRTQVDVVLPEGVAVLNAADERVAALASLCDGEVIYFGSAADLPAIVEHRRHNGRAVFFDQGRLAFATGADVVVLPVMLPSVPAESFLIDPESVLATAAAAWALNLPLEAIQRELTDAAAVTAGTTSTASTLATVSTVVRPHPVSSETAQLAVCVA